MRYIKLARALPALLGLSATLCAPQAHAQVTIIPTFDSSITSDPNAAQIEASINSICALYSKAFTTTNTVHIYFYGLPTGLGTSVAYNQTILYSDYRTRLLTVSNIANVLSPSLPSNGNPVPGNPAAGVLAASTACRTLGYTSAPGDLGEPLDVINGVAYDSDITLNTSITNDSRTGPQDPDKYDIISVAEHEINEVLGLGSGLNGQKNPTPPDNPVVVAAVGSLDFFRFGATGDNTTVHPGFTNTRSFTNDANAIAYFSLDGGNTILNYFNQMTGGDFHDWASSGEAFDQAPQPQTAFTSPGIDVDLGANELLALQACGYNLVPAVLSDVTAQTTGTTFGPVYNRATKLFNQRVTVTLTGGQPFLGPVSLVLTGLTPGVTLVNASGTTSGSPYMTLSPNDIVAGSVLTMNLQFKNPSNAVIGYTPNVMAGAKPN